ncbi:hypothetical protein CkaCkLH20_10826 [Colletotrichum karsti]|uniref:Uncharacterized protein n=1 Tax=Colletotrichum karsti TaxID=1095194 RepID=A0A9P6HUS4_9PEZI|nr:uncharacterized protein CkaCkLH20_10826 [Colletotrichum karsti]KAF9871628.1 hypothetical protein CkaCkLH20_10826 [Colletotrichum karsti]
MPDNDPSDNVFIRFKQKVDGHIASAFQSVLGIPTVVTHNLKGHWPEPPRSLDDDRRTPEDGTVQPRTPSSQFPQPTVFELFSAMSPMQALFRAEEFTESLYQAMWISFLIESPYSPLALRDMPQPTPQDLPADADSSLFGFEDAFEDLLMVSSGQGLPDIHERHRVKREWREQFPKGLPPILWLHQLTRQGLWDGWAPRPGVLEGAISERWQRWLQEQDDPFHERRALPAPGHTSPKAPDAREPDVKKDEGVTRNEPRQAMQNRPEEENRETEEDSYFSVTGKARFSGSRQTDTGKTHSSTRDLSPQGLPSGWRVVENVQERNDGNGNISVTKTVTTFNEKGEEVGKQTERRSDYTWSASFSTGGGSNKKDQQRQENDTDEKSSWFWK